MSHQIETLHGLIKEDARKPFMTWLQRNDKWIGTVLFWMWLAVATYNLFFPGGGK
jgi:hypothetical protein